MDFLALLIAPTQELSRTRTFSKVQEWPLLPASAPLCVFPLAPDCGLQSPCSSQRGNYILIRSSHIYLSLWVTQVISPHTQPTESTALPPAFHLRSRPQCGGWATGSISRANQDRAVPGGPWGRWPHTFPGPPPMCLHNVIKLTCI